MAAAKRDPMYCEHDRTTATCEQCVHADALKDPRRAPATRDELYPFPDGGALTTEFLADESTAEESKRPVARSRRSKG